MWIHRKVTNCPSESIHSKDQFLFWKCSPSLWTNLLWVYINVYTWNKNTYLFEMFKSTPEIIPRTKSTTLSTFWRTLHSPLHPLCDPLKWGLLLSPFYRLENRGPGRWNNLPRVPELERDTTRILTQLSPSYF